MGRGTWLAWMGVVAVLAAPAEAQIRHLATTADGEVLYFSATLPLRGAEAAHQGRIWRWTPGAGLELFAEREREGSAGGAITNHYALERPWVSADGSEVRYHARQDCMVGAGCATAIMVRTVRWSRKLGQDPVEEPGAQWPSRNGRHWLLTGFPPFVHIGYLGTAAVPGETRVSQSPQIVSDSGRLLLTRSSAPRLWLWSPGEAALMDAPDATLGLAVTPDERFVIYEGRSEDGRRLIRSLEVGTGAARTLIENPARDDDGETPVSLTGDGRTALLLVREAAELPRQWILLADVVSGRAEWHTYLGEGFREAVISGNGRVIYAVAESGRLFRFVSERREWTELVTRTPYVTGVEGSPVPGSLNRLTGGGFVWEACEAGEIPLPAILCGVAVEYMGKPGRILRVTPSEIVFQSSWEAPSPRSLMTGPNPYDPLEFDFVSVNTHEDGVYAMPRVGRIRGVEDWGIASRPPEEENGQVLSRDNPARPERRFVLYMHGLGPVDPPAADGMPGPESPLAQVVEGFTVRLSLPGRDFSDHQSVELEVVSASLAPGEFGLYRVELQIPAIASGESCTDQVISDLNLRIEGGPSRRQAIHSGIPFRCR